MKKLSTVSQEVNYVEINQFVAVTDDPEFCLGTTLLYIETRNTDEEQLQTQTGSNAACSSGTGTKKQACADSGNALTCIRPISTLNYLVIYKLFVIPFFHRVLQELESHLWVCPLCAFFFP